VSEVGDGEFRRELVFRGLKLARAWDMLHDPQVVKQLNTVNYMNLCRDAGYTEAEVQKAGNVWANSRMDAGMAP
jgi:hypothetical protein